VIRPVIKRIAMIVRYLGEEMSIMTAVVSNADSRLRK